MPRRLYNYRLKRCIPLLTEAELESLSPHLRAYRSAMRDYYKGEQGHRKEVVPALFSAREKILDAYEEMTGEKLDNPNELYSVRLADFGRLCPECAKPFRTPRARFCAECGYALPEGEVAGPISET